MMAKSEEWSGSDSGEDAIIQCLRKSEPLDAGQIYEACSDWFDDRIACAKAIAALRGKGRILQLADDDRRCYRLCAVQSEGIPEAACNVDAVGFGSVADDSVPPVVLGMAEGGREVSANLQLLMGTRLLVSAASGGGKSWALRRLLEQTANQVQQIVLDPEGEFSSIAEKYPHIMVCNAEDTPIKVIPERADVLARELMRKRISAVLDISGLDPDERHKFVDGFIKGLMNLPQSEWHHVMVVIDEAQLFAPQHDKSDAKKSVIDLACRGRKRGICPVIATQRLSKLHKSVVAELQNRLVGQAVLDVDIRRAADELGMSICDAKSMLPDLSPGEFFVYGPAISRRVEMVVIGSVETTHGAQLGTIAAPKIFSDSDVSAIADAVMPREEGDLQSATTAVDARDAECEQIAQMRLTILAPVIAAGAKQRSALMQKIVKTTAISMATLMIWLEKYDADRPLQSLWPRRVTAQAREQLASFNARETSGCSTSPIEELKVLVPLSQAQRRKLAAIGLAEKHLQVIEHARNGMSDCEVADRLSITVADVEGCKALSVLLAGVASFERLIEELDRDGGERAAAVARLYGVAA